MGAGHSHLALGRDGVLPRRECAAMKKEDLHLDLLNFILTAIGVILSFISIIIAL